MWLVHCWCEDVLMQKNVPSILSIDLSKGIVKASKLIKIESTYLGDNASTADYDLAKINISM